MDRMATTFTEFPAARLGVVTGNEPGGQTSNNSYLHFGASGFHPDFYEPDANQVRHAVGGLIAGTLVFRCTCRVLIGTRLFRV